MRRIGLIVERMSVEGQAAHIAGRCAYDSIRVGDVFTETVTLVPAVTEEDYAREADVKERKSVTLRVREINTAFRQSVDELSHGWTAEVWVEGDGLSCVRLFDVLTNEDASAT